tara:strand:+ start:114 stop:461 length:348 start_codon:yes stop_codon:yes gene_type:complete
MKYIFKIEEYLPDTDQMVIRFARLHSPQHIDNYRAIAIDTTRLDFYSYETFIESLMKNYGSIKVDASEIKDPIVNDVEDIDINGEFDIDKLVGKVFSGKYVDKSMRILKMRRVHL